MVSGLWEECKRIFPTARIAVQEREEGTFEAWAQDRVTRTSLGFAYGNDPDDALFRLLEILVHKSST